MTRLAPLAAVPALLAPLAAHATVYLTQEEAQQLMFPGQALARIHVVLTDAQREAIEARSGVRVRDAELRAWRAPDGGVLIVDEVLGKHDFITYAVALTAAGAVRQIEVMQYLESYGYEIRDPRWRAQFTGKTAASKLRLDDDIRNISGATLSCRHITDGVKRLLATFDVALR